MELFENGIITWLSKETEAQLKTSQQKKTAFIKQDTHLWYQSSPKDQTDCASWQHFAPDKEDYTAVIYLVQLWWSVLLILLMERKIQMLCLPGKLCHPTQCLQMSDLKCMRTQKPQCCSSLLVSVQLYPKYSIHMKVLKLLFIQWACARKSNFFFFTLFSTGAVSANIVHIFSHPSPLPANHSPPPPPPCSPNLKENNEKTPQTLASFSRALYNCLSLCLPLILFLFLRNSTKIWTHFVPCQTVLQYNYTNTYHVTSVPFIYNVSNLSQITRITLSMKPLCKKCETTWT